MFKNELVYSENQLILDLKLTDKDRQDLDEMFNRYYSMLNDVLIDYTIQQLLYIKDPKDYQAAIHYLSKEGHKINKLSMSAAYRAVVTYIDLANSVRHEVRMKHKRIPRNLDKMYIFYRKLIIKMLPADCRFDSDFQYMIFKIQEHNSDKLLLPFRCRLKGRKITVFDGYAWKCPNLKPEYLIRHAESLPDNMEPAAAFLCRTKTPDGQYKYDFRLAFQKKSGEDTEFHRTYLGTLKLMMNRRIIRYRKVVSQKLLREQQLNKLSEEEDVVCR